MMQGETFVASVGCMDGRSEYAITKYAKEKFGVEFIDSITEPGIDGLLAQKNLDPLILENIKNKIKISLEKHHAKAIIVSGHAECAGNPVNDEIHQDNIRESIKTIQQLIGTAVPIFGVFVKRNSNNLKDWIVEEIPLTVIV